MQRINLSFAMQIIGTKGIRYSTFQWTFACRLVVFLVENPNHQVGYHINIV